MFKHIEQKSQLGGFVEENIGFLQQYKEFNVSKLCDEGFDVNGHNVSWCNATHGRALISKNIAFDYWRGKVKAACYEEAVQGKHYMKNTFDNHQRHLVASGKGMYELDGFNVDATLTHIIGFSWADAMFGTAFRLRELARHSESQVKTASPQPIPPAINPF